MGMEIAIPIIHFPICSSDIHGRMLEKPEILHIWQHLIEYFSASLEPGY
jgi:hypothetical protein